jgi:hypothetical protein
MIRKTVTISGLKIYPVIGLRIGNNLGKPQVMTAGNLLEFDPNISRMRGISLSAVLILPL